MNVCHLEGTESLVEVLEADERNRPGIILIGSSACVPYLNLRALLDALAQAMPQFAFYNFTVDEHKRSIPKHEMAQILADWKINPQLSQVLLPSSGKPHTISANKVEKIRKELKELY